MGIQFKKYLVATTVEEREKIKLLSSQLKSHSDERVAEVIIKALQKMKEEREWRQEQDVLILKVDLVETI